MTATKTAAEAPRNNGPFALVTPGMRLLGEILTWTCNGVAVKHADLITALKDAELDEGVARELAPRHAFTRACRKLARDRIIRQVGEDDSTLTSSSPRNRARRTSTSMSWRRCSPSTRVRAR